jgi:hypothetical protein
VRRHVKKNTEQPLMKKLVQSVIGFLIRSGMSAVEVRSILTDCLSQEGLVTTFARSTTNDAQRVGNGDVSAEVMRIWHRDSRFLDQEAHPRPLQLNRGANSLIGLVRRLDPSGDAMHSIGVMRSVGLIRRQADGRYVPTAESVKIDHLHPLAIEHIAKSVVRLVSTVCRNTDPRRRAMPLVERYAYAPDMSRKEAMAFAEFTRNQGMAYLESVDDWLEQRRVKSRSVPNRRGKNASVAAGVHLFAYIDDYGSTVIRGRSSRGSGRVGKPFPTNSPIAKIISSRAARA